MSCYIRKLLPLPRGSSILSGAPFTTSSSRPRLMGPPSQLVSRKIALRPVQGPRHYSRQPNDDDSGDKKGHRYGGKEFWEIIKYYGGLFLTSGLAVSLLSTFSLSAYVIWNLRPSRVNQRRNKSINDLLVGPVPMDMECSAQMEINRKEVITSIEQELIKPKLSDRIKKFGIIIGPTGTGKTFSTQRACNRNPHGVLYTELNTGNFVKEFAEQTGVPIEPRGLFDFVAKHFANEHVHYYKLESLDDKDHFGAFLEIITILSEQAREFKKKHNQVPCLFIDGADLLAKKFPSRFHELVAKAKIYANKGILRIIFVSSEGHIMPLFQSTSSYSRAAVIVEILDIDEEEGKKYLVKYGLSAELSEKVVEYTGGRLIFLLDAINMYDRYRYKTKKEDDGTKKEGDEAKKEVPSLTPEQEEELFVEIKEYLQSKYVWVPYRKMFLVDWPSVELILKEMSSGDQCIHVHDFVTERKEKKDVGHHNVEIAIKSLVEANVFRYDGKGFLRYHNRLIENYIKNKLDRLL